MPSNAVGIAHPRRLSEDDVARIVDAHGGEILRTTRKYSACAADAEDAYQNALEKLLTKAPGAEGGDLAKWLSVVARNEALMIRRQHKYVDPVEFDELAVDWQADSDTPDEKIVDQESLGKRREALRQLKPDHLRCLLLKADGMSYEQISRATGITYASVNRYLTDGRRAYRRMLGRIESGEECRRLEPLLSAVADGVAGAEDIRSAQVHLDHCAACRATLVDFRAAPQKLAALLPIASGGALAEQAGWLRQFAESAQSAVVGVQERVAGYAASLQPGGEMTFAKKAAVATAIAASLTAGGIGVERAIDQTSSDPLAAELVEVAPAIPNGETGPTSTPIDPEDAGEGAEQAAKTAVEPDDADVLSTDAAAGAGTLQGDADPADDPFAEQPQFAEPPNNGNPGDQGGDPYGGLAP